jgi:hypothetical protein
VAGHVEDKHKERKKEEGRRKKEEGRRKKEA